MSGDNSLYYFSAPVSDVVALDEDESRHVLAVMRHRVGDRLRLTDGRGAWYEGELVEADKRRAYVRLLRKHMSPRPEGQLHIGIAPPKQIDRFEWFLEKATELGVSTITPLLCQRSERTSLRLDRLEKLLVAALKQSLRVWLPRLDAPTPLPQLLRQAAQPVRGIAWCDEEPRTPLVCFLRPDADVLVLIGPEGDFSAEEVALARECGFVPLSLGPARLRTETAGLLVVAAYQLIQGEENSALS